VACWIGTHKYMKGYAVEKNNAEVRVNPEEKTTRSPLDEVVWKGAQDMLQKALEIEVETFIDRHSSVRDEEGRRLVVRNGHSPERKIVTGAGQLEVRTPRVDDRILDRYDQSRFQSSLIPPYLRRTKNIDELIPVLYLKGISTGDFTEALECILGKEVIGFSADNVVRLKQVWQKDYEDWVKRDLSAARYVYIWADGVYFNVRLEDERQCILVIIGARADGTKELLAVEDGFRESKESWLSILRDLKRRGLTKSPKLAVGDGALGFWAALSEEYPSTGHQLCWVHKTANVLDKLPKSLQPKAKTMLHNIYRAPTRMDAHVAFDVFIKEFEAKYPKAVDCLSIHREDLLHFYDYPAEQWQHLRSTNVIESTFATVRLRTKRTKGCGSRIATLTMVFKLTQSAEKRWTRLRGYAKIEHVLNNVPFEDGVMIRAQEPMEAAA